MAQRGQVEEVSPVNLFFRSFIFAVLDGAILFISKSGRISRNACYEVDLPWTRSVVRVFEFLDRLGLGEQFSLLEFCFIWSWCDGEEGREGVAAME